MKVVSDLSFDYWKYDFHCMKILDFSPKSVRISKRPKGQLLGENSLSTPILCDNWGTQWVQKWCPFIILTSGSMTFRYPKCGYFGQRSF